MKKVEQKWDARKEKDNEWEEKRHGKKRGK